MESAIKVIIRIRPRNTVEEKFECCLSVVENSQVNLGTIKSFTFDRVFDTGTTQIQFQEVIEPIIHKFTEGYNCTIIAYGQTGSGKTYTMGTNFDENICSDKLGVIPRSCKKIVEILKYNSTCTWEINCQFLELYNEEINDLLSPMKNSRQLKISEDSYGSVTVNGLISKPVTSFEQIMDCLKIGSLGRVTASTNMNATSSRSHAIFSIILNQNLHFVDLAGSERLKRTGATGDRAKEGININQGLLCLGNVINALADSSKKGIFIPYRDSKLTRLLQDSLGGNSQSLMIACISPSECDFPETLSTLVYANRAKNIKNKVSINQVQSSSSLLTEISYLKMKNMQIEQEIRSQLQGEINNLTEEIKNLREENTILRNIIKENLVENDFLDENITDQNMLDENIIDHSSDNKENIIEDEIIQKENLLDQIIKHNQEEQVTSANCSMKIDELTEQIRLIKDERDRLLNALSKRQQKGMPTDEDKRKNEEEKIKLVKEEYENLSMKLENIKALLDKKTIEYKKILQENKQRESQIFQFKNQIEDLKRQRVIMMKEKQSDIHKQRLLEINHNKQIQAAKKDSFKKDILINNLLKKNQQNSLILKRKNEEIKNVHRMLKPIRNVTGDIKKNQTTETSYNNQISDSFLCPSTPLNTINNHIQNSNYLSPFSSLPNNANEKWSSIKNEIVRYLRFLECYHINLKDNEALISLKNNLQETIEDLNKRIDIEIASNQSSEMIEELKQQMTAKEKELSCLNSKLVEIQTNLSQISDVPKPSFEQMVTNFSYGEAIYHYQRLANFFIKMEEEHIRRCVENKHDYIIGSTSPSDNFNDLTRSARARKLRRLTLVSFE